MELNAKRKDVAVLKNESATERQELENKVSIARNKNELIKTERGFEEYVRTTYPVVKEGEGVVVVYDEEKTLVSKVREDTSFFEKISIFWNRFLNKNNTPPSVE
jgi:hypothetical protein